MTTGASSGAAADDGQGVHVYAAYIAEQAVLQEARKASIESRALVVITSSGALATLLLGLAALAGNTDTVDNTITLSDASEDWLRIAILAFLAAGLLALASNLPLFYRRVSFRQLEDAVDDAEEDSEFYATQVVAYNRLYLVENAAKITGWKAIVLVLAMLAEVVAVAAIARSVWLTV